MKLKKKYVDSEYEFINTLERSKCTIYNNILIRIARDAYK